MIYPCTAGSTGIAPGLAVMVVLLLALLNPLACLIHCAVMDHAAHHRHPHAMPVGLSLYVCDMSQPQAQATTTGELIPIAPQANAPRAVYESVVRISAPIAPVWHQSSSVLHLAFLWLSHVSAPQTPPPR